MTNPTGLRRRADGLVDAQSAQHLRDYADLLERTRWIPVTERLPEEGVPVLAIPSDRYRAEVAVYVGDRWEADGEGPEAVTHWMPLPSGPGRDA